MRAHDVDDRVAPELRKMIGADDRVIVTTPHIVHTGFELDEVVNVRSIFNRPVHPAANATEWEASFGVAAGQLLERFQHPILVETAIAKVGFGVGSKLELPTLLRSTSVDAGGGQALQMVAMLIRIHDVNRLVAPLEAVLNKWKQYAIFLV